MAAIEIIAGTNRPGSNARRVAERVLAEYVRLKADARILDLHDLPEEIFQNTSYAEKPASFQPFSERVLAASGLHVITPEYNGSFPGVLKYFIDMLKFPESFERRPVAFIGEAAGIWGAFRAVEQLQMIFGYRNALILPERIWIPRINDQLKDEGGWNDPLIADLVSKQCALFVDFIAKVSR